MTTETFQQTFASQIISLVQQAYACGVLQYHPMTIANMTFTMTMHRYHNQLAVQYDARLLSISVYDDDSEQAQNDTIANLIADMLSK